MDSGFFSPVFFYVFPVVLDVLSFFLLFSCFFFLNWTNLIILILERNDCVATAFEKRNCKLWNWRWMAGKGKTGDGRVEIEFREWKGRFRKLKWMFWNMRFTVHWHHRHTFWIGRTLVARFHLNTKQFNRNKVKKFNSIAGIKILIRFTIYSLHNCCVNCEFTISFFAQFLFILFCIPFSRFHLIFTLMCDSNEHLHLRCCL